MAGDQELVDEHFNQLSAEIVLPWVRKILEQLFLSRPEQKKLNRQRQGIKYPNKRVH